MEKSSAARAETDGLLYFFLERERRRAGIDLSSLPISLKFQINKIHFSAPLPSPPQQTKEKQFPAVCSKLLSPSLSALQPLSHFRGFLTSASCSRRRLGDPWAPGAELGKGPQTGHPVIQWCLQARNAPAPKPRGAAFPNTLQHLVPWALTHTGSISPRLQDPRGDPLLPTSLVRERSALQTICSRSPPMQPFASIRQVSTSSKVAKN